MISRSQGIGLDCNCSFSSPSWAHWPFLVLVASCLLTLSLSLPLLGVLTCLSGVSNSGICLKLAFKQQGWRIMPSLPFLQYLLQLQKYWNKNWSEQESRKMCWHWLLNKTWASVGKRWRGWSYQQCGKTIFCHSKHTAPISPWLLCYIFFSVSVSPLHRGMEKFTLHHVIPSLSAALLFTCRSSLPESGRVISDQVTQITVVGTCNHRLQLGVTSVTYAISLCIVVSGKRIERAKLHPAQAEFIGSVIVKPTDISTNLKKK